MPAAIRIGTAGWTLPSAAAAQVGGEGSHLERYSRVFDGVEINSTFYRLPRSGTIERWREITPPRFQFAIKVPGSITHESALRGVAAELGEFLGLVTRLGPKLGPLLVQLPPSLEFEAAPARRFLRRLRTEHAGEVVWEPRHASWFGERATALLLEHRVARVAADPAPCAGAELPAGFSGVEYHRLHGSPRKYYSEYSGVYLEELARRLVGQRASAAASIWCVFDNTASGAALPNALELRGRVAALRAPAAVRAQ